MMWWTSKLGTGGRLQKKKKRKTNPITSLKMSPNCNFHMQFSQHSFLLTV